MPVTRRSFNTLSLTAAGAALAPATVSRAGDIAELYDQADALELAAHVRSGQLSAQELLEEAIRRVEQVNPRLNAVTIKHYELARKSIAAGLPDGPFRGVPFLLKDLGVRLEGTVTSYGSRLHKHDVAGDNSELVARYRNAGLVIFGKTNVPEYGLALTTENLFWGDCLNPWNPEYSTGGSSGGSAAAVAAGVLPVAHGTDGGGSIRVPANHCGVFGFKPTRGRTPGVRGSGMSIGHVLSRSVRDSAAMLDVTAAYEPGAPYGAPCGNSGFLKAVGENPGRLRIALNLTVPDVEIHADCRLAVMRTAEQLEKLGHSVEEAAPPLDYDRLNEVQNILIASEVAASLQLIERGRGKAVKVPEIEPMTDMIRRSAADLGPYAYATALQDMHGIGLSMGRFLDLYDAVLQPVTATPPPRLGTIIYREGDSLLEYTRRFKRVSAFTHLYNMSGQPSMSLPLALSADGLPIGVMISGRVGDDARLFSLAAQLERTTPWRSQRPLINAYAT